MSFFWVYLRYQSYFGLLYPLDSPTGTSPAFGVLLVVLLVLCAFSIAFRTRIEKIFLTQRFSVVLLSAMASGGAAMALAADSGLLGAWALWASLPLVAAGFVAGYLGWATYFCYRFGPSDIVVLAASYLASLVFFTQWVPYLVAVFVPLGVGVSWFFAQPPRGSAVASRISSLKEVTPFVVLFIAFLLSGSILRGIVDSGSSDVDGPLFRWPLSVVVSAIVLFGCWISVRRMKEKRMGLKSGEALWMQRAIDSMALKGWAALALMFFAAVFCGGVRRLDRGVISPVWAHRSGSPFDARLAAVGCFVQPRERKAVVARPRFFGMQHIDEYRFVDAELLVVASPSHG